MTELSEINGYTFRITSSITDINLPYVVGSKNLKIFNLGYKTATSDNRLMIIRISGFNNQIYYDGSTIINHAFSMVLPNSIDTESLYISDTNRPDVSVKERGSNETLNKLRIETSIQDNDGTISYKDISASNPLYLSIKLF